MPPTSSSPAEQQDSSALIDQIRQFASDLLDSAGGVIPFAATIQSDGTPGLVVHQPAQGQSGQDLVNRLIATVREQARSEQLRAAGIAYQVTAKVEDQNVEALVVSLQHRAGPPRELMIPFQRAIGTVQFGDAVAQQGTVSFFQ